MIVPRRKPKHLPEPRFLSRYQLATYLNRSEAWLTNSRLDNLYAKGFPRFDVFFGGWDIIAVDRWLDRRAGLDAPFPGDNANRARIERWSKSA